MHATVDHVSGQDIPRILRALEKIIATYIHKVSSANHAPASIQSCHHRDAFVASVAHSLLLSGSTANKRDLYYMSKTLFGVQANADAALQRVANAVPTHRNNLNILAAAKGIVAGNVSWISEDGTQIDVASFGPSGTPIPPRPERFFSLSTGAPFVLVVEKETIFTTLAQFPGLLMESECILITGKGYPDYASRLYVRRSFSGGVRVGIVQSRSPWKIPVVVLTDADPHGLHIALTYAASLPRESFRYMGVRPSERICPLGLKDDVLLPVTMSERVLAENILAKSFSQQLLPFEAELGIPAILQEFQYLLSTMVKFEIEALVTLDMSPVSLVEYIKERGRSIPEMAPFVKMQRTNKQTLNLW